MSDDKSGWVEAAEITTDHPYETAEAIKHSLPDEYRVIDDYRHRSGPAVIERRSGYGEVWMEIAVVTEEDAYSEWGEEIGKGLGDEFRAVFDYTRGCVVVEERVEVE